MTITFKSINFTATYNTDTVAYTVDNDKSAILIAINFDNTVLAEYNSTNEDNRELLVNRLNIPLSQVVGNPVAGTVSLAPTTGYLKTNIVLESNQTVIVRTTGQLNGVDAPSIEGTLNIVELDQ